MGNFISCTLSAPAGKHSRTTTVIFPTGEIKQFNQQIKAAELMFETPNFFLVNSQSLSIGRRFSALAADEDLEMANSYFMFPMKKLNSVITASDLGSLFVAAANSAAKLASYGVDVAQIVPEPPAGNNWRENDDDDDNNFVVKKLNLDDLEEFSSPEFKHRLSLCRSKKPMLETIAEEPIYSR